MPNGAPAEQFEPGKTYRCLTATSIFHCDHITQGVAVGVGTPRRGRGPDLVFHPVRDPGEWVEAPEIPHVSQAEHKASRSEWQPGGEYWSRPSPEPVQAKPARRGAKAASKAEPDPAGPTTLRVIVGSVTIDHSGLRGDCACGKDAYIWRAVTDGQFVADWLKRHENCTRKDDDG